MKIGLGLGLPLFVLVLLSLGFYLRRERQLRINLGNELAQIKDKEAYSDVNIQPQLLCPPGPNGKLQELELNEKPPKELESEENQVHEI